MPGSWDPQVAAATRSIADARHAVSSRDQAAIAGRNTAIHVNAARGHISRAQSALSSLRAQLEQAQSAKRMYVLWPLCRLGVCGVNTAAVVPYC